MRLTVGLSTIVVLAFAGSGAAQNIELFGSARLGVGYNVLNDGEPALEANRTVRITEEVGGETVTRDVDTRLGPTDDLRAVSRIRFGVVMTGESDSGVAFGAEIRADNAESGDGGDRGQRGGEVFVTGSLGTLTFGDIDGADYARVGDPIGNATLTGLGDFNELPFLSNGGGSDNDELQFLSDPDDRPTVRYDYDFQAFGLSLSTNRDLDAVGVGGNYTYEFDGGEVAVGAGYYDFTGFTGDISNYGEVEVPDGDQWSASLTGSYGDFSGGVGYTSIDAGSLGTLDVLATGLGAEFGAWEILAYYSTVVNGDKLFGEGLDGKESYGASAEYDLGGGVSVNFGVARTYGADAVGDPGDDNFAPEIETSTLADFGITMSF